MSTTLSEPDKVYKKSFHHNYRNDSGEIDVFEAARYFSGYNEVSGYNCGSYTQKIMGEEREPYSAGRMSLDVPVRDLLPQHRMQKPKKEKKHKQPSSPGGRLASFLNSLFNQAALKKKKSKSSTQSMKDEEESPGGRRRRRSSISHFRSSSTTDTRSVYPSSTSGFRTPPPYTPTKGYRDFGNYSDHREVVPFSKYSNGHVKSTIVLQNDALDDKRNTDLAWLDEKFKLHHGLSEKCKITGNDRFLEKDRLSGDKDKSQEKKEIKKFDELDDGAESDSSSDLFELQNYDLGYYPSGLPVYETTHPDSIKRGAQISNCPL